MFGLFTNKPLLEESASQWLLEAFAWALANFDADYFYQHTTLVLPTNEFFPGRVDSVDGMAGLILDRVKGYAGASHWPTRIADQSGCSLDTPVQIEISGALRRHDGIADESVDDARRFLVPYNPQQINNPEAMIANFAHILAHYMGQMGREVPPGGMEYWPQATELLAIYLGFGVMFSNSAFTFRGGCGSCYNANANREAYLSELEATYALAIFSVLKRVPNSAVTGHLKKHLRGFYKKAVKEVEGRVGEVVQLRMPGERYLPEAGP